jgi:hypothetical protein
MRGRKTMITLGVIGLMMLSPSLAQAADSDPGDDLDLPAQVVDYSTLEVEPAAESCVVEGDAAYCIEEGAAIPADEAAAGVSSAPDYFTPIPTSGFQTFAMVPVPDWCLSRGVTTSYASDRHVACRNTTITVTIYQAINGVPTTTVTGEARYVTTHYIYTGGTGLTRWGNQIRVSPTSLTGSAVGMQVTGAPQCSGACTINSPFTFPPAAPAVGQEANGESYYNWTGQAGEVSSATSGWTLTFARPGSAVNISSVSLPGVPLRCDNALPGVSAGCVFSQIPAVLYYGIDTYPNLGWHIAVAQNSGLPGSYLTGSNPLHRVDSATAAINRNASCPSASWLPRPTGFDCDEYPFASSAEGGAASGGTARTWNSCQITLQQPNSTGPNGFSICMVPSAENQYGGSALSLMYRNERVLIGDPFYVDVVQGS